MNNTLHTRDIISVVSKYSYNFQYVDKFLHSVYLENLKINKHTPLCSYTKIHICDALVVNGYRVEKHCKFCNQQYFNIIGVVVYYDTHIYDFSMNFLTACPFILHYAP